MTTGAQAFFSYCREDSDFALKLAEELKAAGASVWMDQLDIALGDRWDRAVEEALTHCSSLLVILSPASVASPNVMDEVSFALDEGKTIIPVIYRDCAIPFRLRRLQHADFTHDFAHGVQVLLKELAPSQGVEGKSPAVAGGESPFHIVNAGEHQRAAEQAQIEEERRKAAERSRLEEERNKASERAEVGKPAAALVDGRFPAASIRSIIVGAGALTLIVAVGLWVAFVHSRAKPAVPKENAVATASAAHPETATEGPPELRSAPHLEAPATGAAEPPASSPTRPRPAPARQTPVIPPEARAWKAVPSSTQESLQSIFGTSGGKRLWVAGTNTILLLDNFGGHWNVHVRRANQILRSIFGSSDGTRLWAVGYGGTILESDNSGGSWIPRSSGTTEHLYSVFGASDGRRVWAVGHGGTILESDDGGGNWIPRSSGTRHTLHAIFGTGDGRRLWIVGYEGTILESDDGGGNWSARNAGTSQELRGIFGTSDGKRLWTVGNGGTILESDDGGGHWSPRGGTSEPLRAISGTSDGKQLWATSEAGTILESDNGGGHWNARSSGTTNALRKIFVTSDGKRVWAVGDRGTILESTLP